MAVKIGFISLGCPKNRVDTEVMMARLQEAGYDIVSDESEAEIVVINTCAFIKSAKEEAIENILDAAWLKENAACRRIIVTGCLAERYRSQILSEMPEVDYVLGAGAEDEILAAVRECEKDLPEEKERYGEKDRIGPCGARVLSSAEYSVYLKIAEGCDNRCSFCAIPGIRGRFRSREIDGIIEEAKALCEAGAKEITLVAQDTSRYGVDIYGEKRLPLLLRRLSDETDARWIRLLYCYPEEITDELVEEIAKNDKVVKYIDMPVQHISDTVLKRMNRRGGSAAVYSAVKRLREKVPGIILRTTLMTGFPGETEEDFETLCDFVREMRFERLGVFAYSPEEDTPAADFDGQIDPQTAQDRADKVMRIQLEISESDIEKRVGKEYTVLCEGYDVVAETYFGRSFAEAPEIDGRIFFSSPDRKIAEGEFVKVKITESFEYDLLGEVAAEE